MTNLELLQQAESILSKPLISSEDINGVKRIIRDEITLQMYELSQHLPVIEDRYPPTINNSMEDYLAYQLGF